MKKITLLLMFCVVVFSVCLLAEDQSDDIFNGINITAEQKTTVQNLLNEATDQRKTMADDIKNKKDAIRAELKNVSSNRELMVSLNTQVTVLLQKAGEADIDRQLKIKETIGNDNYLKLLDNQDTIKQKMNEPTNTSNGMGRGGRGMSRGMGGRFGGNGF